jgi:ubiquinone/menaquinone biosynthesis C-methylase UbiE
MTSSPDYRKIMEIYPSYNDEPKDTFSPLPEELYCDLYEIEMERFSDDILFYKKILPERGNFLELGCGTGRITECLAQENRTVVGIDISLRMLQKAVAKRISDCSYINMDMRLPAFSTNFDAILIPYNTLNLLSGESDILSCLKHCRTLLNKNGKIYLQLFIPDKKLTSHRGRVFQFQMFDRPEGGKIIKEILRQYSADSRTILVEERYRIRPMKKEYANQNLNHFFTIAGYSYDEWVSLFKQAGLYIVDCWGDYDLNPFHPRHSSCLLAILSS